MKYILSFALMALLFSCDAPDIVDEDNRIQVYPNPATNVIEVYLNNNGGPFILKGYDTRGKEIINATTTNIPGGFSARITITESGTYRFTLDMDNKKGTKTILAYHE